MLSPMFIMRDQVDVIHDEEQYMLQTPVKIDVKQEIKEENTTEEQQSDEQQMLQTPVKIEVKEEIKEEITAEEQQSDEDDDEQQMLQTPVKIEVKQQEIKEENTAEEQQSDEDDYSPSGGGPPPTELSDTTKLVQDILGTDSPVLAGIPGSLESEATQPEEYNTEPFQQSKQLQH
ncbi:probable inactive protein kinase DDB_G0270444 isoform X3 [Xyrauchen texanus]|uniref:probable inactive protein kinase DDB_G0270444 isoform X3 n=1 Tax=Xyrauchen texanus TaxID=154827 RepID=UPI0022423A58|nr:probable inactive protein kinase DDB_G0270444 isoform X3 [Xyrauchen texanus]